jgi:hypothetical protein
MNIGQFALQTPNKSSNKLLFFAQDKSDTL